MKMLLTILLAVPLLSTHITFAADLTVVISKIEINQGRIYVGLYSDPVEFPNGRQKAGQFVDSDTPTLRMVFTDLSAGDYAFAVFQDNNGNEILDMNFLGIPKEPYGFSGGKVFGEPDFEDAAVTVRTGNMQIEIKMN